MGELLASEDAEDAAGIVASATSLSEVLLVAAAEAPKTASELSFALLEETRALRSEVSVSVSLPFRTRFVPESC